MGVGAGTLAAISAGAALIGTGVSVYGAMQQGAAQKKAADYQAQVAQNNKTVADQNAAAVQRQAEAKAQADQRAGALRAGAQRAALGASGVTLDSGSALDLQAATASNTALGTATDIYEGKLKAYGYEAQASNFDAESGLATMKGDAAVSAGYTTAAASLLSGASSVAGKWDAYKRGYTGTGQNGATP